MTAAWAIAAPMLLASTWFILELPSRRTLYYPFAFVAFASFLTLGPASALLAVAAAAIAAAVRRRLGVLITGVAIGAGIGAGHLAHLALGASYPLPLDDASDLGRFLAAMVAAFTVFGAVKRLLERMVPGEHPAPAPAESVSIFAIGVVIGTPMQLAAHLAYVHGSVAVWTGGLAWSFAVNLVIAAEVARMRRNAELLEQLASKERLAAIGETTARIVHQTRHQLGLIGMIAHQIERRIRALPEDDARAVREQLARLEAVHEDLRRMLADDLAANDEHERDRDYASVVRRQATRLEPLATSRGVRLGLHIDPIALAPDDPDNFGQGVFNVLENAIVAARREVEVTLTARADTVVLDISDDGPGIAPELIPRATQPFVTTKPGGTGMGLAIARAVVEAEGGELSLANREQGGLQVRLAIHRGGTRPAHG